MARAVIVKGVVVVARLVLLYRSPLPAPAYTVGIVVVVSTAMEKMFCPLSTWLKDAPKFVLAKKPKPKASDPA